MTKKTSDISDELRQRAFAYYTHHPEMTLGHIADCLGVSRDKFLRLRKAWKWPPRREASQGVAAPQSPARTLHDAALALARVTRLRIDALIRQRGGDEAEDHDRTARALASYARTLTAAQALLEQEGRQRDEAGHCDEPARSLNDLRDELARHLERVIAEEEARGRDGLLV